jgi:hypothetical protein
MDGNDISWSGRSMKPNGPYGTSDERPSRAYRAREGSIVGKIADPSLHAEATLDRRNIFGSRVWDACGIKVKAKAT